MATKTAPKKPAKTTKPAAPVKPAPKPKPKPVKESRPTAGERSAARVFHMFGDPTRVTICFLLRSEGEMHVGAICEAIGVSQPAVSHHLALLRASNILVQRRDGKNTRYSLTDVGRRVSETMGKVFDI